MVLPDKHRVHEAIVQRLTDTATHLAQAAQATREGATHEEAKPENDKDTRALEQTYLARGQAMRVEELLEQTQVLRFMPLRAYGPDDAIGPGALVMLQSDEGSRCLFLAPHGGGTEVTVDGVSVLVVTANSSLGAAVLGRYQGDDLEVRVQRAMREYEIVEVA